MSTLVLGIVQMNSRDNKRANLQRASALIDEAARQGATFIGVPELFNYLGPDSLDSAEPLLGPTVEALSAKAREHSAWIHGGSFIERSDGNLYYNTTVVIDSQGQIVARYRKIHLFDVQAPGQTAYRESATVSAGNAAVVFDGPWGKMGLTICYDLRFGELYRSETLAGARLIWCPAAFTLYTGKDHWETLVRARAIENQVFMACPAQFGSYSGGTKHCFGSAMIVDPWGAVLARAPERECSLVVPIDFAWQDEIRSGLPVLEHRRPAAYHVTSGRTGG